MNRNEENFARGVCKVLSECREPGTNYPKVMEIVKELHYFDMTCF